MNKLLLYSALLLFTQCIGCKKKGPTPDPPQDPVAQLPPETQTGQRTFGCLVNGQPWTLAGSPLGGPLLAAQYHDRRLSISMVGLTADKSSSGGVMQIGIDKITTSGRYILSREDTSFVSYDDAKANCLYRTDVSHPATVEITRLDPVARIASGRFAFTLETPSCGKVVVTGGRFDCRF